MGALGAVSHEVLHAVVFTHDDQRDHVGIVLLGRCRAVVAALLLLSAALLHQVLGLVDLGGSPSISWTAPCRLWQWSYPGRSALCCAPCWCSTHHRPHWSPRSCWPRAGFSGIRSVRSGADAETSKCSVRPRPVRQKVNLHAIIFYIYF